MPALSGRGMAIHTATATPIKSNTWKRKENIIIRKHKIVFFLTNMNKV
jgi:hypothetical protein